MLAQHELDKRAIPPLPGEPYKTPEEFERQREHIRHIIEENAYGVLPKAPDTIHFTVTEEVQNPCAGMATVQHMCAEMTMDGKTVSFPFFAAIPKHTGKPCPALVYIRFFEPIEGKYMPLEELMQRGFAIFSFCYQDVALDSADFESKLAPVLCPDRSAPNAPGKIAMWAWAAMRVMDYVQTREDIDLEHVGVIGHSRLGKTALLAGAYDERFRYVISNDSGCLGAAISRKKAGETYERIATVFPYWFCPRMVAQAAHADTVPFDQHFLLALTVPRHLLIGSAEEDVWADPVSEFISIYKMNELYRLYGKVGVISDGTVPCAPYVSDTAGDASYHLRHGTHYMSRTDFNLYMDYIEAKRNT